MQPFYTRRTCSLVCVCLHKTAEPIAVPFGRQTYVGPRKPVLEAGPDPPKEIFDRASACLLYRIGTPKVDVRQRCGLFSNYFGHFLSLFWFLVWFDLYFVFVWSILFRSANWRTVDNDSFELTSLELVNIASGYPQISEDNGMWVVRTANNV